MFKELDFIPFDFSTCPESPLQRSLMTFPFFLHFDFCSTCYNSVLKFSSLFWLKKRISPRKLVQYAIKR